MSDLLSTDELLLYTNEHKGSSDSNSINEQKENRVKFNKKYLFGSIVFIAVLHLIFMALPMISSNLAKNIFGYQYIIAITNDQALNDNLTGTVVKISDFNPNDIEIGKSVFIYGLYDRDIYWEVDVLENDSNQEQIEGTFDNIIRNTYTYDQIEGIYVNEANFIGIFYYTASTTRGFLTMMLFHGLMIYTVYYLMLNKKVKIKKV